MTNCPHQPIRGAGIGLRARHYPEILENQPEINWFEVLSDNYFGAGGLPRHHLEQVRSWYPVTMHGVGLSLGSADPLNKDYLIRLKTLADWLQPAWVSEHLAWVSVNGRYLHDLMPVPYTEEALNHIAAKIVQTQEFLGRRILLENPSAYLAFDFAEMSETEFFQGLVGLTDCDLLLDINNVFVSASNLGFDAQEYLQQLPAKRVKEIHLAGYEQHEHILIDTHGYRVHPPVWDLYKTAIAHLGPVPTLIEWDSDVPALKVLLEEADKAERVLSRRAEQAA